MATIFSFKKKVRGFSLYEVIVVVAILGLVAAFAVPEVKRAQVRAQAASESENLRLIESAKEAFAMANPGRQPATAADLMGYLPGHMLPASPWKDPQTGKSRSYADYPGFLNLGQTIESPVNGDPRFEPPIYPLDNNGFNEVRPGGFVMLERPTPFGPITESGTEPGTVTVVSLCPDGHVGWRNPQSVDVYVNTQAEGCPNTLAGEPDWTCTLVSGTPVLRTEGTTEADRDCWYETEHRWVETGEPPTPCIPYDGRVEWGDWEDFGSPEDCVQRQQWWKIPPGPPECPGNPAADPEERYRPTPPVNGSWGWRPSTAPGRALCDEEAYVIIAPRCGGVLVGWPDPAVREIPGSDVDAQLVETYSADGCYITYSKTPLECDGNDVALPNPSTIRNPAKPDKDGYITWSDWVTSADGCTRSAEPTVHEGDCEGFTPENPGTQTEVLIQPRDGYVLGWSEWVTSNDGCTETSTPELEPGICGGKDSTEGPVTRDIESANVDAVIEGPFVSADGCYNYWTKTDKKCKGNDATLPDPENIESANVDGYVSKWTVDPSNPCYEDATVEAPECEGAAYTGATRQRSSMPDVPGDVVWTANSDGCTEDASLVPPQCNGTPATLPSVTSRKLNPYPEECEDEETNCLQASGVFPTIYSDYSYLNEQGGWWCQQASGTYGWWKTRDAILCEDGTPSGEWGNWYTGDTWQLVGTMPDNTEWQQFEWHDNTQTSTATDAWNPGNSGRHITDCIRCSASLVPLTALWTMDEVMITCCVMEAKAWSPVIVDLGGLGYPDLLAGPNSWRRSEGRVSSGNYWHFRAFDLDGSGEAQLWEWAGPTAGILVSAPGGELPMGRITGKELFGNRTWGQKWQHGYRPLATLDADGDGYLRGAELAEVAVWQDKNSDALIGEGEIRPAAEVFVELCVRPTAGGEGNWHCEAGAKLLSGEVAASWDWWSVRAHTNRMPVVTPSPLTREECEEQPLEAPVIYLWKGPAPAGGEVSGLLRFFEAGGRLWVATLGPGFDSRPDMSVGEVVIGPGGTLMWGLSSNTGWLRTEAILSEDGRLEAVSLRDGREKEVWTAEPIPEPGYAHPAVLNVLTLPDRDFQAAVEASGLAPQQIFVPYGHSPTCFGPRRSLGDLLQFAAR